MTSRPRRLLGGNEASSIRVCVLGDGGGSGGQEVCKWRGFPLAMSAALAKTREIAHFIYIFFLNVVLTFFNIYNLCLKQNYNDKDFYILSSKGAQKKA